MTIAEPITLDEAKLHLHVEHSEEDAYIQGLISAAREYAENFTGRLLAPRVYADGETPPDGETIEPATAAEKQAILLILAHWYAHREAAGSSLSEMPYAAHQLLWFNRRVPV